MKEQELLGLMLPDGVLEYFEIETADKQVDSYKLYLIEKNNPPQTDNNAKLYSKGFYDAVTIQDFPLRGKACYLIVKRRRWFNPETGTIITRDWNLVAKGTRLTLEFAAFLKELNRYNAGKYS